MPAEANPDANSSVTTPSSRNTIDANAKLSVGGKEVTVAELLASYQAQQSATSELNKLKGLWGSTKKILTAGDTLTPEIESDFRSVLSEAGYAPADIEAAVAARKQPTAAPEPNAGGTNKGGAKGRSNNDNKEEEMGQVEDNGGWTPANIKMYTEMLDRELRTSTDKALTEDPALVQLLKPLMDKARTDSTALSQLEKAKADLRDDIRRDAVAQLQRQRAQLGDKFGTNLVPGVVQEAAKNLGEKYSRFGSLQEHLGKVTTVTPEEKYGVNGEAPKEPVFKPGDNPGKVAEETLRFNEFVLLKAAAELEKDQAPSMV